MYNNCLFIHFIFFCTIFHFIYFQFSAIENYVRLCTPQDIRTWFNKRNTTTILLLIWVLGSVASGMQFIFDISFDYCTRRTTGMLPYQAAIVAMLIIVPLILSFYMHMRIIIDVKRFMKSQNFKPSLNYTWDLSLTRTNFYSFLIFVTFWLPFGIVLSYHTAAPPVANKVFYTTAWIGLSKSCFHNVIYCITNRHFRNAYVNLFHYCCCKTTVSVSRRQRNDVCRPSSDVRVHIIPGYNMYSYTSPQRSGNSHSTWNKRDIHEL